MYVWCPIGGSQECTGASACKGAVSPGDEGDKGGLVSVRDI